MNAQPSNVVEFPKRFDSQGGAWNPALNKKQAAALLKRSTRWIELMHREGIPHYAGPGGRTLYPHDELLSWWQERRAS